MAREGHPDHCSLCRKRYEDARALAGEGFCKRAEEAAAQIKPMTEETRRLFAAGPEVSGGWNQK